MSLRITVLKGNTCDCKKKQSEEEKIATIADKALQSLSKGIADYEKKGKDTYTAEDIAAHEVANYIRNQSISCFGVIAQGGRQDDILAKMKELLADKKYPETSLLNLGKVAGNLGTSLKYKPEIVNVTVTSYGEVDSEGYQSAKVSIKASDLDPDRNRGEYDVYIGTHPFYAGEKIKEWNPKCNNEYVEYLTSNTSEQLVNGITVYGKIKPVVERCYGGLDGFITIATAGEYVGGGAPIIAVVSTFYQITKQEEKGKLLTDLSVEILDRAKVTNNGTSIEIEKHDGPWGGASIFLNMRKAKEITCDVIVKYDKTSGENPTIMAEVNYDEGGSKLTIIDKGKTKDGQKYQLSWESETSKTLYRLDVKFEGAPTGWMKVSNIRVK